MAKAVFITGTDTDVGKTFVSAILVKAWESNYWKPFQTGLLTDPGDTKTVKTLTGLPESHFEVPQINLNTPLSPWRAAMQDGIPLVSVDEIKIPEKFLTSSRPLVVEGAGGLFVPVNEKEITTDLIRHLDLPVILVARSSLGTINHTLLSIEHLKRRGVLNIKIILNGELNNDNAKTIEHFSPGTPIIAQIPHVDEVDIQKLSGMIPHFESLYM